MRLASAPVRRMAGLGCGTAGQLSSGGGEGAGGVSEGYVLGGTRAGWMRLGLRPIWNRGEGAILGCGFDTGHHLQRTVNLT
jgi:hypothetical protein